MSRSRSWVFTDFDVSDERRARWLALFEQSGFVRFQLEKSPSTGKLHFQGECQFSVGTNSISWFKSHLDNQVHVEIRRDKTWNATSYCTKPESRIDGPWQSGRLPKSRGRPPSDFDSLCALRGRLLGATQTNHKLHCITEPMIRYIDRLNKKLTLASIEAFVSTLPPPGPVDLGQKDRDAAVPTVGGRVDL